MSDRDEMRKIYKGLYIDASWQVWFHLSQWFQRRLKCETLTTDDGHFMMAITHMTFWVMKAKKKGFLVMKKTHLYEHKKLINAHYF